MLSRAAAAGLAGLGLALLLSWLAALAMNHDVLPGTDVRLAALVCCGLACLAAGALSPRPEQGRALGGAMTWAVWAIGYLILKAAVGAQVFCAATAMTVRAFFIKSYEIEQRRKNGNRRDITVGNQAEGLHNHRLITYILR